MTDKNIIRIIGGKYKSRKINILPDSNIRPTPDRIRETLFNWLMHDINNARVLDLFAGSGAISIEALSRGADFVFCNDLSPKIIKHLEKIITNLTKPELNKSGDIKLSNLNTVNLLNQPPEHFNQQPFDIIILDPPFNKDLLKPCLENLIKNNWLNFNKLNHSPLIYFEAEDGLLITNILEEINNLNINNLSIIKQKITGKVIYGLITVHDIT